MASEDFIRFFFKTIVFSEDGIVRDDYVADEKPFEEPVSDYGFEELDRALSSRDYGWSVSKGFKKVTLVNPKDCKHIITIRGVMNAWKGTGHREWEAILAGWFVQAVKEAIEDNSG